MPFVILFTKSDKAKKNFLSNAVSDYQNILSQTWDELPQMILTSSKNNSGKSEILHYIEKTNKVFHQEH